MKPEHPVAKLEALMTGDIVIMSDDDLDLLCKFDASNVIRSRPNPAQIGTKDRYECWIERRDLQKLKRLAG